MTKNPFDAAAPFYDSWYDVPLGRIVDDLEKDLLYRLIAPQAGERCLDVGVGTGHFAFDLAAKGLDVVGVDLSRPMLEIAQTKEDGVSLIQADAERLPLSNGLFDLAISVTTLEFVSDPASVVSEMWRVLKPGGRLVVAVLNEWSPWAWARKREFPFTHAHFFAPPEFVGLLRRFGPVQWSSSVFIWPDGRGMKHAWFCERIGRKIFKHFGALLVGRVVKWG